MFYSLKSLFNDLFLAIPVSIITAAVYWLVRRAVHKKRFGTKFKEVRRKALLNEIIRLLFVLWLALLFGGTLLPSKLELRWHYADNLWGISDFITRPYWNNLIPRLDDLCISDPRHALLNTAMFVPIGLALPFIFKRENFGKILLTGFCMTLTIELLQGFVRRESDFDDIVFNTLGTVVGYLLYLLMKRALPKFTQKCAKTVSSE